MMVALIGSEKQVAWAEEVRTNLLTDVQSKATTAERAAAEEPTSERKARRAVRWQETLSHLAVVPYAGWWIDHRNSSPEELAEEVEQPAYQAYLVHKQGLYKSGGETETLLAAMRAVFGEKAEIG